MDKCFDKPRKDVSLHPKLLREHTFILILAMKKNVYFLLALLLIGLSACDNAPKFKFKVKLMVLKIRCFIWKRRDWMA